MFDEKRVTRNIKALRLNRNMTLDQLSKLTDLTKGYLSRIENSTKAPPICTLSKLADAFGVDILAFFADDATDFEQKDISIIRKHERLKVGRKGSSYGYIYEALAYRITDKNMEPFIITVSDEASPIGFQHKGEEFIYMLQGKLEFTYDGEKYLLEEGDSVYFNSGKIHTGKKIGDVDAKFLCIIYS